MKRLNNLIVALAFLLAFIPRLAIRLVIAAALFVSLAHLWLWASLYVITEIQQAECKEVQHERRK